MPFRKRKFEPRLAIRVQYVFILVILLLLLGFYLGGSFLGGRGLVINEVMASNRCTITDEDGDYPDWFEIYNPGDYPVSMDGYWATNDPDEPYMWKFPAVIIEPAGYLVVFTSGKDRANPDNDFLHTNFRLSTSESTLLLIDPEASILDRVITSEMLSNVSYGRKADNLREWSFFLDATPNSANNATPYEQVIEMPMAEEQHILINEFLTSNQTSLPDEDGDLSDWIELYNPCDTSVDLTDYWLSDKSENAFRWRFPAVTIEPEQFLIVFASGKNRRDPEGPYLHTNFRLNDQNDTLVLSMPDGTIIDKKEIRNMERDVSYGRDIDDPEKWLYFPRPTPSEENYTQGFEKFSGNPVPRIFISEVMAINTATIADEDGDYYDWIEIYNPENFDINLEGYGLSDCEENPYRWEFPNVTIKSGSCFLLFASGKDRRDPGSPYLHTNFKIKATGETLALYHPSGIMIDSIQTGKLTPDHSVGRLNDGSNERYFFDTPAPGSINESNTYSGHTQPPAVSHQGGFYSQPFYLEFAAPTADASIRYTLDGSEPDVDSNLYIDPLPIEKTSVVRASSFAEGKLSSPVVNRSFFLGDKHNLTVVSVMTDPEGLWHPEYGIYVKGYNASNTFPYYGANFWKDMEKPIHLEIYEPDGTLGLGFDAGIKIGGQFSRGMDQKIFNVFARNIYGHNEIRYPIFPRKDLTHFKALTLRTSGQDAGCSKIRDIMMASLLEDTGLDYQDHRQAVLYLNGEYWGIYNIRERANRYFIAHNHDLDPDKIDLLQANWIVRAGSNEHYLALLDYVQNNDLAIDENYEYVSIQMDITNYIDALITQIYYAQTDQGNIRIWREQSPEGIWRWLVFDFDWCFWPGHVEYNTLASMTNPAGTGFQNRISTILTVNLLRNQNFEDEFIKRFAYHINNTFEPERVVTRIDELAANIESEIPRHFERWGGSVDHWYHEIDNLREFARLRPAIVVEHIRQKFQLSEEEMQILSSQ
ncbi:MAG: lamin tail domain-containing protein [Bacillota bacterium]